MNTKATTIILIATHNPGKLSELKTLLKDLPLTFVSLDDVGITFEVEETGRSFEENALLKAQQYAKLAGLPTIADDGGLVIDALAGWPGVDTAYVGGQQATVEDKIQIVLEKMKNIPDHERTAHFVNVNVLVYPDGPTKLFKASLDGILTREPRGPLKKGLPYRLIFLLPEFGKTMAELDAEGIMYESHRKKALDQLKSFLKCKK